MTSQGTKELAPQKPKLQPGISVADFMEHYWLKEELVDFARSLGLSSRGAKPELRARIERRLRGEPDRPEARKKPKGRRDSEEPLTRATPVVHYKSDAKTRAFFEAQIGSRFHFTYRLNQYRQANEGLTYGDLVDEWLAEEGRRRSEGYQAPLAEHGKYNLFVRAFFADEANKGKSMKDAAAAWNESKTRRGEDWSLSLGATVQAQDK